MDNFISIKDFFLKGFTGHSILEAVIAAIIIALLFFLIREKYFGYPDLSGKWYLESVTEESSYNPYINMILHHQVFLRVAGNIVEGMAEKTYEDSSYGKRTTHSSHVIEYIGKHRAVAEITGCIIKNYFSPDVLILHAVEVGERRKSTIYSRFKIRKKYCIFGEYIIENKGIFYSMVSNQKGYVRLSKQPFSEKNPLIEEL